MQDYFSIYWTYPVRWVGLTRSDSAFHAARVSRTIRYQRAKVLRHAASRKRAVLAEAAFLENAAGRGLPSAGG